MTDIDLDELLETAVLEAALADGRTPALAARQFGAARVIAAGPGRNRRGGRSNVWTAADEAFLARQSGVMTTEEIAAVLGRTRAAIDTQQNVRGLARVLTHPAYITAQQMSNALGLDSHTVLRLVERGLLPAELVPFESGRRVWRARRTAFYAWALNPRNWAYFVRSVRETERIRDEKLRRLIVRRAAVWGDEWWSIGEVARYHNADHQLINKYIRAGRLPAVDWGNWWILRSEATRPGFRIWRRPDGALYQRGTPAADGFLVLAMAVGLPSSHISRMMGGTLSDAGVVTRYRTVAGRGLIPWLARVYDLPVETRPEDGTAWADWRPVARRFPALARAWARLDRPGTPGRFDRALLAGVLRSFLRFHRPDCPARLGHGDAAAAVLRDVKRLYEETIPWTA